MRCHCTSVSLTFFRLNRAGDEYQPVTRGPLDPRHGSVSDAHRNTDHSGERGGRFKQSDTVATGTIYAAGYRSSPCPACTVQRDHHPQLPLMGTLNDSGSLKNSTERTWTMRPPNPSAVP